MKYFLICIFIVTSFGVRAQIEVDFLNAVGKKDLSSVSNYLANTISLCIDDNQKKVAKGKAIAEIKSFLKHKSVKSFKILHNGKASDKSSSYRVARLKTESGTFRIFAYSENTGGSSRVIEVRIDPM